MTNLKKWQIIKSELVFQNRWCQVRQDAVKLS
ncbi:MAG: NUDIX hydrolase, partial [Microcystis sp.]